ncbi:MAG: dockerin type I repeat-containing protein [Planctomycetes bacterium]|nr:dockerin type I repeat-containing protein [Planctomycetota bacterium]
MLPTIALGLSLFLAGDPEVFIRGDADGSGTIEDADAALVAAWLWKAGPPPACFDAADANDDGAITEEDVLLISQVLQSDIQPLPPPFPQPGADPTPDGITCSTYEAPSDVAPVDPEVFLAVFGAAGEPGGDEVEVPIMLRGPEPVGGLTIAVRWDPTHLHLLEIRRTGETVEQVRDANVFESDLRPARGEASFTAQFGGPPVADGEVLPPQENFACVGKLVFAIDLAAPPLTSLPVEIVASQGEDVPRFTALSTNAGLVAPRRVGCSIAVREPGTRRIRQAVRVPIVGLADDPLAEVGIDAHLDPDSGMGHLAFSNATERGKISQFPYCFLGAHLMAMILRGLAVTHGMTGYGAKNLASLTSADALVFDLREEFPIEQPERKGPPYDPPGESRGELRISTRSSAVLYFDWDVSGLDYERLPCPGTSFAFEWALLERKSLYLTHAAGDFYKGAETGGFRGYFNWRRIRADIAPASATFDSFSPEVATIDITFDPDTGAADYWARIVPADYEPIFWRGDVNADQEQDVADAVMILEYLFHSAGLRPPIDRADANDDGAIDIGDPVYLLGYLFGRLPPLAPAWQVGDRTGGVDPTP